VTLQSSKILVVDDTDAGRFVKVQTLRRAGYHVVEAATGRDGMALIESERPDLALLDVNLPDISGFEVSRRIRAAETGPPTLPIVQISSTAVTPADRVKGLERGADVYLTEPVEPEVLVATVQALLRVRKAESALAAALERERHARQIAEEASRLKDDFIATLSHELRTPLNALMGWIWQLRHTTLNDESRTRALDSLERNAQVQAQLINDLLDVSRISKGKLQLQMRMVDVKVVVETIVEGVGEVASRKGVDLTLQLDSVAVAGDQARLQQVVGNLLTNAVQFTPADGRVTVRLAADGDDAVLSVEDTGAGIEAVLLPHIFDPFRQGEGGLSRSHGGLGLGLAVVKQLVDLHGGDVMVSSAGLDMGATFTIRLPRETGVPAAGPSESRLLLDGLAIEIAADDGANTNVLQAILESSGARVGMAERHTPAPPGADIVVRQMAGSGALTFRIPSAGADAPWLALPDASRPAQIVRTLARATARTS
jgi:signal transduction histidine kinase